MLGIKHSYHSHISNEVVTQRANQKIRLKESRTFTKMSEKRIDRQMKFTSHLLRAEETDITTTCIIDRNGLRTSAGFNRTGRPRIKWYDQVMDPCFDRLVTMGMLLPNWREDVRADGAKQIALQAATYREF